MHPPKTSIDQIRFSPSQGMENEPKPVVTGYPAAAAQPGHTSGGPVSAYAYAYSYPNPAHPYYAAPPPAHPPAPYYDPAAYNRGNNNTVFLRRLIGISIAVFLLIGAASFILWLVLRPHIPEFAVSSASVSSFNLSSQQLSSDFNLNLAVRNPNKKMGIYYDKVEAAVLYGSEPISVTSLPPFFQGKGNSTVVPARFSAVNGYLDSDVGKGIARERATGGSVNFHVRVLAWVRFTAGEWRTRRHVMRVYCDNVRVGFSNATTAFGSLVGPSKQCRVDL